MIFHRLTIYLLALWMSCGCNRHDTSQDTKQTSKTPEIQIHQKRVEAMGTLFNFTIATSQNEDVVNQACDGAFKEISRIEAMMSSYRDSSVISQINRAAGQAPVKTPKELIKLIEKAIDLSKRTEGKFDITFGPIGKLWDFRKITPALPDLEALKARLLLLNYRLIRLDKAAGTVFLEKTGMSIGLGAIAKGYGVDRAAEILRQNGLNDFIVYGGGDIYFSGDKAGKPWRVGIQDPRERHRYFADFPVNHPGAVVTSGDYEKFFVLKGRRYHHIIDPATGYPATASISVTVVTENAADADALATGIFILGPERGMALIESTPKSEGVIVDKDFEVHVSSGLKKIINLKPITRTEN